MNPLIKISGYTPEWSEKKQKFVPGCIPYETDLYTELERIRDGYYKPLLDELRLITDEQQRRDFKAQKLPSITISCICKNWRNKTNIVSHTGLLNVDIDDKNNNIEDWGQVRDKLAALPNIIAVFLSASGRGVTLIVKVYPKFHIETLKSICWELQVYMNIYADENLHDVTRLRFISYDPECKIKYNIDEIQPTTMNPDYVAQKKAAEPVYSNIKAFGKADSMPNFKKAVERAQLSHCFMDGEKHNFLLAVAGYCVNIGMSKDFCCKLVVQIFAPMTDISTERLLQPIHNAYNSYKSDFGKYPPKPYEWYYRFKELRFFLRFIHKNLIRSTIKNYEYKTISGETNYTIKVDSVKLVYLMWVIAPQYTWTVNDDCDEYFTTQKCKSFIPDNAFLEDSNGARVWIHKEYLIPLSIC